MGTSGSENIDRGWEVITGIEGFMVDPVRGNVAALRG